MNLNTSSNVHSVYCTVFCTIDIKPFYEIDEDHLQSSKLSWLSIKDDMQSISWVVKRVFRLRWKHSTIHSSMLPFLVSLCVCCAPIFLSIKMKPFPKIPFLRKMIFLSSAFWAIIMNTFYDHISPSIPSISFFWNLPPDYYEDIQVSVCWRPSVEVCYLSPGQASVVQTSSQMLYILLIDYYEVTLRFPSVLFSPFIHRCATIFSVEMEPFYDFRLNQSIVSIMQPWRTVDMKPFCDMQVSILRRIIIHHIFCCPKQSLGKVQITISFFDQLEIAM